MWKRARPKRCFFSFFVVLHVSFRLDPCWRWCHLPRAGLLQHGWWWWDLNGNMEGRYPGFCQQLIFDHWDCSVQDSLQFTALFACSQWGMIFCLTFSLGLEPQVYKSGGVETLDPGHGGEAKPAFFFCARIQQHEVRKFWIIFVWSYPGNNNMIHENTEFAPSCAASLPRLSETIELISEVCHVCEYRSDIALLGGKPTNEEQSNLWVWDQDSFSSSKLVDP